MRLWPLLLLAPTACDDIPRARTEAEIADMATDAAGDVAAEGDAALEARIVELESSAQTLEAEVATLQAEKDSLQAEIDSAQSEHEALRSEYDGHQHY